MITAGSVLQGPRRGARSAVPRTCCRPAEHIKGQQASRRQPAPAEPTLIQVAELPSTLELPDDCKGGQAEDKAPHVGQLGHGMLHLALDKPPRGWRDTSKAVRQRGLDGHVLQCGGHTEGVSQGSQGAEGGG